jgi:hypothetical protein
MLSADQARAFHRSVERRAGMCGRVGCGEGVGEPMARILTHDDVDGRVRAGQAVGALRRTVHGFLPDFS